MATVGDPPTSPHAAPGKDAHALPSGARLAEFEIRGVLGLGGFGIVYLAFDHSLHRQVAIKEYLPGSLAHRDGTRNIVPHSEQQRETFQAGLRSFIQEARLLAQFDHPALVKVYRFWEGNGTAYMATAYYEGVTLKQAYGDTRPGQDDIVELIAPLLDAVEVMHRGKCYHRDIAPDNVMVQPGGMPVLLDFGAARRVIGEMTQALTVVLKSGYAPIEQYADDSTQAQGPWTDVYAVGAMIHWMIRGKSPPASVMRTMNDPYVPLASQAPTGFDDQFLRGVDRALAMRPDARPQTIAELRAALGMPAQQPATATRTFAVTTPAESDRTVLAPHPRDVRRAKERRRFVAAVAGIVVAAVAVTALVVLNVLGPTAPEPKVATVIPGKIEEPALPATPALPPPAAQPEPAPPPATPPAASPPPPVAEPPSKAPVPAQRASPPRPSTPAAAKPATAQPAITDPKEQYDLARDLQRGTGRDKDPAQAVVWLRRSADQGYARAQLALGAAYESGDGVTKDLADAFGWYKRAAVEGNVEAQMRVARAYRDGIGVAKDTDEALAWYGKAAAKGNAEAKEWVARLQPSPKRTAAKEAPPAAKPAPTAADQQYELGLDYRLGRKGFAINQSEAVKWIRSAADQGYAPAQNLLGHMYRLGQGVAVDYSEARKWLDKSAANGNADAMSNIGVLYQLGQGVKQNDVLAADYFRKAANAGSAWGMNNLAWMMENGRGVFRDTSGAVSLYNKAADKGNADAMFHLARLYERGEGVRKDEAAALDWYRAAARNGNKDASRHVERLDPAKK
jgi:TPR repeat protein/serine/threonine protein kinase